MTESTNFYVAQINRAIESGKVEVVAELAECFARDADLPVELAGSPPSATRTRRMLRRIDGWTLVAFNPLRPRRTTDESEDRRAA